MEGKAAKWGGTLAKLPHWTGWQIPTGPSFLTSWGWLWQPSLARAILKPRTPHACVRWAQGWLCQSKRRNMVPTAHTQLSGSGFETSAQQQWFSSWLLFIYWKLLLVTQKEKQLVKAYITQFYVRQDDCVQSQAYKKNMCWKAPKSKHFSFQ